MANIHMGYMGHCTLTASGTTTQYLITGSSLNAVQTINAPDLVAAWYLRKGWNYGKVEIGGNVTGPLHDLATSLWSESLVRSDARDHMLTKDIEVDLAFYKAKGLKFSNCSIGTLELTATAGEVVNFTIDFMGSKAPDSTDYTTAVDCLDADVTTPCSKLITWDRVQFGVSTLASTSNFQSFTFTVNNNLERQYSITGDIVGTADLYPVDITAGLRNVSGTVSMYAEGPLCLGRGIFPLGNFGANKYDDYDASDRTTVTFAIDTIVPSTAVDVVFNRPESSATVGTTIYTLNWTAVCDMDI